MLKTRSKAAIFVVSFLSHSAATWVAFTKSELIRPTATTYLWRHAAETLAFPALYVLPNSEYDLLLPMMLFNSILWAALVTMVVVFIYAQFTKIPRLS